MVVLRERAAQLPETRTSCGELRSSVRRFALRGVGYAVDASGSTAWHPLRTNDQADTRCRMRDAVVIASTRRSARVCVKADGLRTCSSPCQSMRIARARSAPVVCALTRAAHKVILCTV